MNETRGRSAGRERAGPTRIEQPAVARAWNASKTILPYVIVAGLMVAGFLLRRHNFYLHTEYTTDSYYFMILARSLRAGLGYTVRGNAHALYPPAFPLITMLVSYVIKDITLAAAYITMLGAAFSIFFTYLVGKELLGKVAGLLGAAILTFQPAFLKWTSFPMAEGLFTLCFTAGVYFWLTGCRRGSKARRFLGASLGGMALLTRIEGLIIFPLMVIILLLYLKEAELSPWELTVELALFAVPFIIFLIVNVVTAGKITEYTRMYFEHKKPVTAAILGRRLKTYGWNSLMDKAVMVLFYAGAAIALVRRRKAFLILFSWPALFLLFHLFWYWTYERYMVPAIPAMALLAGYVFQQAGELSYSALRFSMSRRESLVKRVGRTPAAAAGIGATCLFCVVMLLLAAAFALTINRELNRGSEIVKQHAAALSADYGGRALPKIAGWLEANVKDDEKVASDFGPDLNYAYSGPLYYVQSVPTGDPQEDADFRSPGLLKKLSDAGVRYLVLGYVPPQRYLVLGDVPPLRGVDLQVSPEIPADLVKELADLGFTQSEVNRLKLAARFQEKYDYPVKTSDFVILKVPPPGGP